MKRLLILTGFTALFILTACGNNSETTICTLEDSWATSTITVQSEGDQITSAILEEVIIVGHWSEEDIQYEIDWIVQHNDGVSCELDGDELTCRTTVDAQRLEDFGYSADLESLIDEVEADGGTCN